MYSKSAVVETENIGHNVTVGEFAIIRNNVIIGNNVIIHPHVIINEGVVLGPSSRDIFRHSYRQVTEKS
jgi:UDP-3-O-[3-hydroxymyristoyl] glucosamine N-acyltransferase